MKTLYINIDGTVTSSNEHVEVINYSLYDDFFFHVGEKIAGEYADEVNLIKLMADFNTPENSDAFAEIVNQWKEVKAILFGDSPHGEYVFELPKAYLTWLRLHTDKVYNSVYKSCFADNPSASITLNIEDVYNDTVEWMRKELFSAIDKNETSQNCNWLVLADEAITKRTPLMYEMSERYKTHTITIKQWVGLGLKEYTKNVRIGKILSYETFIRTEAYQKQLESYIEDIGHVCYRIKHVNTDGYSTLYFMRDFPNECISFLEKETTTVIDQIVDFLVESVKSFCLAMKMNVPLINREKTREQLSILTIVDELRRGDVASMLVEKYSSNNLSSHDRALFSELRLNNDVDRMNWLVASGRFFVIRGNVSAIEKGLNKRVRNTIEGIMHEARKLNQTHYYMTGETKQALVDGMHKKINDFLNNINKK